MAFIETYLVPLLLVLATFAVLLGLAANLLAARLALEGRAAANDALFDHSKLAYRTRRSASAGQPGGRAALALASQPASQPAPQAASRHAAHTRAARPYFPDLAYQSGANRLLKRVS